MSSSSDSDSEDLFPIRKDDPALPDLSARGSRKDLGVPDALLMGAEHSKSAQILDFLASGVCNCNIHSQGCWGFCVVRTCHAEGDDARVTAAMSRLDMAASLSIRSSREHRMTEEPGVRWPSQWDKLWGEKADKKALKRYHNILIESPELNGATLAEARTHFEQWAARVEAEQDGFEGPRAVSFILLDAEVLDNLESAPAEMSVAAWDSRAAQIRPSGREWIKLVDAKHSDRSACRVWLWSLVDVFGRLIHTDGIVDLHEVPMTGSRDGGWPFYWDLGGRGSPEPENDGQEPHGYGIVKSEGEEQSEEWDSDGPRGVKRTRE